jgi:uncharacterized protein
VRVGLISDTHGSVRPAIHERLAGVERLLHAGDVGGAHVLAELATIAPLTAVAGNTDGFDVRARVPEEAQLELAGRRVVVVHGHRLGSPTPEALHAAYPEADIIVYGHTHRPLVERVAGTLIVNPGAAGPARFGLSPSVAVLTLAEADESVELLDI